MTMVNNFVVLYYRCIFLDLGLGWWWVETSSNGWAHAKKWPKEHQTWGHVIKQMRLDPVIRFSHSIPRMDPIDFMFEKCMKVWGQMTNCQDTFPCKPLETWLTEYWRNCCQVCNLNLLKVVEIEVCFAMWNTHTHAVSEALLGQDHLLTFAIADFAVFGWSWIDLGVSGRPKKKGTHTDR